MYIGDAATLIDRAQVNEKAKTFVIGAGASRSARIPISSDLMKTTIKDFNRCLVKLGEKEKGDYGKLMGCLTLDERRTLLRDSLKKTKPNRGISRSQASSSNLKSVAS